MNNAENNNTVDLLTDDKQIVSGVSETVSAGENEILRDLCYKMKELNQNKKAIEKELEAMKSKFKDIAASEGIDRFEDDNVKVTLTVVDKSFIRAEEAIQYLKDKGLNKFVHTKEYIDDDELLMAITRKEVNANDFAQFIEEKKENRINIR